MHILFVSFQGCPNLLTLSFKRCTSITKLPDSIGRLSKLRVLDLGCCEKLQNLPTSIAQLTALEELCLGRCKSLEALPDFLTALSRLQRLHIGECFTSAPKLPAALGLVTSLTSLQISLATKGQACGLGQLYLLEKLHVRSCTDEVITVLDRSRTFGDLARLRHLEFRDCPSMTKIPESIGLSMNLQSLSLVRCEKVKELRNSIERLKNLKILYLRYCTSLETLPDSLGSLTSLIHFCIVSCTSITELPKSVGNLSRLRTLHLQDCGELRSLPDSLSRLDALRRLLILECGSNLEGLGVLRALRGLRIWGCSSITELPGPCLAVVDSNYQSQHACIQNQEWLWDCRNLKEVQVEEANDCGFLRHVRNPKSDQVILQRVHNLKHRCKSTLVPYSPSSNRTISLVDDICAAASKIMSDGRDRDPNADIRLCVELNEDSWAVKVLKEWRAKRKLYGERDRFEVEEEIMSPLHESFEFEEDLDHNEPEIQQSRGRSHFLRRILSCITCSSSSP